MSLADAVMSGVVQESQTKDFYFTASNYLVVLNNYRNISYVFGIDLRNSGDTHALALMESSGSGKITWSGRLLRREGLLKRLSADNYLRRQVEYCDPPSEGVMSKLLQVSRAIRNRGNGRVLAGVPV